MEANRNDASYSEYSDACNDNDGVRKANYVVQTVEVLSELPVSCTPASESLFALLLAGHRDLRLDPVRERVVCL